MPVVPLDAAATAAVAGVLSESHGRYRLAVDVQEALRDYFKARGRGVVDLPWDVDKLNEAGWEREWRAYLTSAGITDTAEAILLIEWLRARSAPGAGPGSKQGVTKVALETLENNGYKISAAAAAALERELSASEAGSEESQCCNPRLAFRLLMNIDPTPEQEAWWHLQFSALASVDGGAGIDIPGLEEYKRLHKPSNSAVQLLTLERALRNERDFDAWLMQMAKALEVCGLPKASIRLMMVVSQASAQAAGMWEPKKAYLMGYFFREYRGLGLPRVLAHSSAYNSMGAFAAAHAKGGALVLQGASGFMPAGLGNLGESSQMGPQPTDLASLSGRSGEGSSVAGSALGSSVSSAQLSSVSHVDVNAIAAALTSALVPALRAAVGGEKPAETGGASGGGSGVRRCPYCRRSVCPMLEDSSKHCRAASEALALLKAKTKAEEAKKDE